MEQRDMNESPRLQELYARRVAAHGGADAGVHATPEAILAAIQRDGPEAERLVTIEHVMSCAACHRDYEWLKAVDDAGEEFAERSGEHRVQSRPWWQGRQLALAASLLMALGAALAVRGVLRSGPELVRGGSGDIALLTPATRVAADAPLAFAWRAVPGVSRYVLEIQRADGSVAFTDTIADTVATVAPAGRLLPDTTYRWWVREVTDGSEPRSSALRELRLTGR
jgi:hypothetical protein